MSRPLVFLIAVAPLAALLGLASVAGLLFLVENAGAIVEDLTRSGVPRDLVVVGLFFAVIAVLGGGVTFLLLVVRRLWARFNAQ